jgi:protein-S-isoprenylcysteine O-methyltransferase Ste14
MVLVVIPAVILYCTNRPLSPPNAFLSVIGFVSILLGLSLMVWTNRLFITVGKGTLAPFDPTKKLVVQGIYKHVRNPMILGVFCILLGETIFFCSLPLLGWFAAAVIVNLVCIPLVEEPGLVKRFDNDYLRYKANVPRWIPRLTPWRGLSDENGIRMP